MGGAVYTAPLDGGRPTLVTAGELQPVCIAVDGDTLYWTSAGGVKAYDLAASTEVLLASEPSFGLAFDGVSLVVDDGDLGEAAGALESAGARYQLARSSTPPPVGEATGSRWASRGACSDVDRQRSRYAPALAARTPAP